MELPNRLYTHQFILMGAKLEAESQMRQQVIALYGLIQEGRLLDIEERVIQMENSLLQPQNAEEDVPDAVEMIQRRDRDQTRMEQFERRRLNWRNRVGEFFMTNFGEIHFDVDSLPDITYDLSELDFSDTSRWGMLQLNQLALEQIAYDARLRELYLRYVPSPSLSVSAPQLYASDSNRSFDPEDIRFGPELRWSLDTRGMIRDQINRLRDREGLDDWRRDRRRHQEIQNLLEGKRKLELTLELLEEVRVAIAFYAQAAEEGLISDFNEALRTMRQLREREVRLTVNKFEIYMQFWLIDESRWGELSEQWLVTRDDRVRARRD